jgi:hypothetical protein
MKYLLIVRSLIVSGMTLSSCLSLALAAQPSDDTSSMPGHLAIDAPLPGATGNATFESPIDDRAIPLIHIARPPEIGKATATAASASNDVIPVQLGHGIALQQADIDTAQMRWQQLSDQRWAGRFEVKADDAGGLRAALRIAAADVDSPLSESMLAQTQVHFGGANQSAYAYTAKDLVETDNFWSPLIAGNTLYIEIVLPVGVQPDTIRIALPRLSYFPPTTLQSFYRDGFGESYYRQVDVICKPQTAALRAVSASVAKMSYTKRDGNTYACTGTLLDNDNQPKRHLFLTARHCISDQATANSLETVWFYQLNRCGGNAASINSGVVKLSYGARLLVRHPVLDTSLLELNSRPPEGANYQAWSLNPVHFSYDVIGVHHPHTDVQKYASGQIIRRLPTAHDAGIIVAFGEGGIEGGSSGSGLFKLGPRGYTLEGNLSGGSNGGLRTWFQQGHYADFSQFYPAAASYFQGTR